MKKFLLGTTALALLALVWTHKAEAFCPTPNPNIVANPGAFVDNCPLPATSLNKIGGGILYYPAFGFGAGNPQLYVNNVLAGNTDTNNLCFVAAKPCTTWQHAYNTAAFIFAPNQIVQINVAAGTYAGGVANGSFPGGNGRQFIYTVGAGAGVTIFNAGGATYPKIVFEMDTMSVTGWGNFTCTIPASSGTCFFMQSPSYASGISGDTIEIIGADSTSNGVHTESSAVFETPLTTAISIKGTFASVFNPDNKSELLIDGSTITCEGTVADTQWLNVGNNSNAKIASATNYVNCSGTTGDVMQLYTGGTVENMGADFPGNGYVNNSGPASAIYPPYRPTVTSCTNGAITANSTNGVIQIVASGSISTCTIVMGTPSTSGLYNKHNPVCNFTQTGTSGGVVQYGYNSNDSILLHIETAGSTNINGVCASQF